MGRWRRSSRRRRISACSIWASTNWISIRPICRRRSSPSEPRRVKRRKPGRVERRQIDGARRALGDQLGHRFAGRWCVENTPDAVAGSDISALDTRDPAATLTELQAQLDRFREIYNHQRPHRAIGRRFPAEVWQQTPRSGPASHALGTPTTTSTTQVTTDGRISIATRTRIGIGIAHAGKTATTVITGTNAHVFINGRLERQLTINPTTRDQPKGV